MIAIPVSYYLTNIHFIVGVLSFFSFFTTAALYMDSFFSIRKSPLLFIRSLGFFMLAVWGGLHGALGATNSSSDSLLSSLLLLALVVIAATFFIEDLPGRPTSLVQPTLKSLVFAPLSFFGFFVGPAFALIISLRLWYQATVKLERSRKFMALAMLCLTISWFFAALSRTPAGQAGSLSVFSEPFGIGWIVTLVFEAVGSTMLLLWAWNFLRFRLFPQLYLTVVGAVVIAFVATTMLLTVSLITNAQQQSLRVLSTNVRVFAFTLEELKQKMTLVANTLSNRSALIGSVEKNDIRKTQEALGNPIADFKISGVTVLNAGGEVLYTLGTDLRPGASLSSDAATVQAFTGASVSTLYAESGPEFPAMFVRSAAPVVRDGAVLGAVVVDFPVDTVFLDRVKDLTGLEIILFGGSQMSATTLRDESGRPRLGSYEKELAQNILSAKMGYQGSALLGHERFLTAGLPIVNLGEKRIGALAVGISEAELLKSLDEATQRTLLGAVVLIILSLVPLYGVARVIARYQSA